MPTLILFIPKAPPQRLSFHNICPDGRTQIYILVYHNLPPFSSINIKSHKNVLFCNKMADNHQPNKVPIPNDKPRHYPPPQFRPTASAVQSPRIIAERLRISETAVFSYSIKSSTFPQPPFPPRRRSPFTSRRRLPTFNGTTPPRLLFQPSDYSHPNRDQPFFLRSRQVFLPLTCPYSPLSQLLRRCCFFFHKPPSSPWKPTARPVAPPTEAAKPPCQLPADCSRNLRKIHRQSFPRPPPKPHPAHKNAARNKDFYARKKTARA